MKRLLLLLITCVFFFFVQCTTSDNAYSQKELTVVNRTLSDYASEGGSAVEMDAKAGDGLVILNEIEFETGTIEIDLLGENNPGQSFIGIAFNIQNDSTYEAIYFRPFNFVAEEQIRREHMVQYIFHPEYGWNRLRKERTAEFEAEIPNPPNPDEWFGAIITVTNDRVQVRLSKTGEPVLDVARLSGTTSNKIAYWVGHNSSGRFDNLKIKNN